MPFNQSPHTVLMIKPAAFGFNEQTASSNAFQKNDRAASGAIHLAAVREFDSMVALLSSNDIAIKVFDDSESPAKPDAIFPNNWISFHENGSVIIYPMMAENRRLERRMDIIEDLKTDFLINQVIDMTSEEANGKFLEGTGSMVFDHVYRKVYACRSIRTDLELLRKIGTALGYKIVVFDAVDENDQPIYHTNVMLSIGKRFIIVCLDAIKNEDDQEKLLDMFSASNRKVVAISYAQMHAFAGNMIELQTETNESVVVLSETALASLLPGQINAISLHANLLPVKIDTIEKYAGGSVRCMIAGIHLPKRN